MKKFNNLKGFGAPTAAGFLFSLIVVLSTEVFDALNSIVLYFLYKEYFHILLIYLIRNMVSSLISSSLSVVPLNISLPLSVSLYYFLCLLFFIKLLSLGVTIFSHYFSIQLISRGERDKRKSVVSHIYYMQSSVSVSTNFGTAGQGVVIFRN